MAKLTNLHGQLEFNKEMEGIINVLKGVAASEFANLQRERKKFDEFHMYINKIFKILDVSNFSHVFIEDSPLPANFVIITSDGGFLGNLNISIIATLFERYKKDDQLTVLGSQGARYVEEKGIGFKFFPGISNKISYEEVQNLRDYLIAQVLSKKTSRTVIIFPHFISFAIQEIQAFQLFPCRRLFSEKSKLKSDEEEYEKVIIEPFFKKVIEYLIQVWLSYTIYSIFWESKLSEWAARVIHLEGSSDEVVRQGRIAKLEYFRALHAESDKNIREIFSSTMVLRGMRGGM